MSFLDEIKWRGLVQDLTQGTEEALQKGGLTGYIGFDPTAPSLTIGNLVPVMLLVHLQRTGHKPIALIGGATGMIGDPSGKDEERKLLPEEQLRENERNIVQQLSKFLDTGKGPHAAELLNNHDWYKNMNLLSFLREAGKYLTVSYLLSKGFIKERLKTEISFTEFNYILLQAYDFLWLHENKGCVLQMGGSDQWGNITAGIELIRKKIRKPAYGLTCPLITKSDGTKFGKTEEGNVWLDPRLTSPYKFYQFWLNASDEDAARYLRIFTLMPGEETEACEKEHLAAPHLRKLQHVLAKEVTERVHSRQDYESAVKASEILFGKATRETLIALKEKELLEIFDGVPRHNVPRNVLQEGADVVTFLADHAGIFSSRGEARRAIQGGGLSINKEKVEGPERRITLDDLLNNRYLLAQKGKKQYHLVVVAE